MKVVILTETEAVYSPAIQDLMEIDGTEENEGFLNSDCWIDCDYIKVNGEFGSFFTIQDTPNDTTYIILGGQVSEICDFTDSDLAEKMLIDFFNGKKLFSPDTENTWDSWRKIETGIAYRGGSGYVYGIYEINL